MNPNRMQEGISDPLLASAFDDLREDDRYEVDWERLRSTINSRAELALARRRTHRRSFARRSLVPLTAAASIAFALWIGPGLYQGAFDPVVSDYAAAVDDDVLMQALMGDLTEQELLRLVNGNPEVLLAVAIGPR